jgi:hypothetical protein
MQMPIICPKRQSEYRPVGGLLSRENAQERVPVTVEKQHETNLATNVNSQELASIQAQLVESPGRTVSSSNCHQEMRLPISCCTPTKRAIAVGFVTALLAAGGAKEAVQLNATYREYKDFDRVLNQTHENNETGPLFNSSRPSLEENRTIGAAGALVVGGFFSVGVVSGRLCR